MNANARENSIRVLKQLLDVYQGQLDAGVVSEVREVIAALEQSRDGSRGTPRGDLGLSVLRVMGEVLKLVTNITNLMN
ncbi:hypothetical protein [Marilutibacter chinensis]|uniref:Uncharacterized protein n=1 Tax=Marilutibacter chinensis TaxID=2912247 RepID=A0ABS9HVF9_9GAMM|nr:hypothetical protein [Lysobacter chinensis]MCF7222886.1 hypothetical protein [Lysobacter chinensis]